MGLRMSSGGSWKRRNFTAVKLPATEFKIRQISSPNTVENLDKSVRLPLLCDEHGREEANSEYWVNRGHLSVGKPNAEIISE